MRRFTDRIRPRPFKRPALAVFAILAMGVGIGAVGGTVGVARSYLRPLPFPEPDRLVHVFLASPRNPGSDVRLVWPEHVRLLQEGVSSLESVGAYRPQRHHLSDDIGPPVSLETGEMSSGAFRVLGIRPHIGRWPTPADEADGAEAVVLVSHRLWQSRFGGDPDLPGRAITLDGMPTRVIGVMPEGFGFPRDHDLWFVSPSVIPLRFVGIGRLADGATLETLNAELEALSRGLRTEGADGFAERSFRTEPYADYVYNPDRIRRYRVFGLMGLFVLIAACANVATLLLVRSMSTQRETAIRMALGAPRNTLIAEQLLETLVLAGAGGLLGLALTWTFMWAAVLGDEFSGSYWTDASVDAPLVALVAGTVLGAALLAGVLPALRGTDLDLAGNLQDSATGSSLRLGHGARALVVIEVALSAALLVVTTTAGGWARQWVVSDLPVPPERFLLASYDLHPNRYDAADERLELHRRLVERLADIPTVEAAALTGAVPGGPPFLGWWTGEIEIPGTPFVGESGRALARYTYVSPGYFAALGTEVTAGRAFDWQDRYRGPEAERPVIVTESFVQRYLRRDRAVGTRMMPAPNVEWTVVGVVPDVGLAGPVKARAAVYVPLALEPWAVPYVLIRARGDPLALARPVREAIWALDPQVPVAEVARLDHRLRDSQKVMRILVPLIGSFGVAALLLTGLGLHGVVAFSVRRRTREIAIRSALGARAGSVARLVLRGTAARVFVGAAVGLAVGYAMIPFIEDNPIGAPAQGPLAFLLAFGAVALTAILATARPLVRALRSEVMEALRVE